MIIISRDEPKRGNKMIDIHSVLTEKCATFMFVFFCCCCFKDEGRIPPRPKRGSTWVFFSNELFAKLESLQRQIKLSLRTV